MKESARQAGVEVAWRTVPHTAEDVLAFAGRHRCPLTDRLVALTGQIVATPRLAVRPRLHHCAFHAEIFHTPADRAGAVLLLERMLATDGRYRAGSHPGPARQGRWWKKTWCSSTC
jgi:hypothetical protein